MKEKRANKKNTACYAGPRVRQDNETVRWPGPLVVCQLLWSGS